MRSSFIKYCICTFDERFSVCGLFLFADISTAVNKHHSSQAQQIVIVATIIQGDSYFCCLNSWSVIKAGSLKKSHVLCFLYILRIETCSMMWNTGLYSFGNWTCMITALLLSVARTNLQSMKSDLIKIVWSKSFSLRLWGVIWCMCYRWKYADSESPLQRCKTTASWLPGLQFRSFQYVFQCGQNNNWKAM